MDDKFQHACLKARNLKQTFLSFSSSVFFWNKDIVATTSKKLSACSFRGTLFSLYCKDRDAKSLYNRCWTGHVQLFKGIRIFGYRNNLRMKSQRNAITFSFQKWHHPSCIACICLHWRDSWAPNSVDTTYVSSASPISHFFLQSLIVGHRHALRILQFSLCYGHAPVAFQGCDCLRDAPKAENK